ncbi:hypothetical protein SAMN04487819_1291 [Actinopolyspora alba]|uniref:Uncharacterized protein n=2 Tax=Actinopolyspora alba TaxID=673379 RepID=A0A1I2CN10_9ACTN|nr:hypothetical protein SAMN04487819_1291 [Actinopolyspora alba]
MATVRQIVQFDNEEIETLRSALHGRAVNGLLEELRNHLNRSIQPSGDSETKKTRLSQALKPGAEVTGSTLTALEKAISERKETLFQLSEFLGEDAQQTRELLQAHEQAEQVTRKLTDQVPHTERADSPEA